MRRAPRHLDVCLDMAKPCLTGVSGHGGVTHTSAVGAGAMSGTPPTISELYKGTAGHTGIP